MYPLSETQYCPCDKYNAQPVGNWSDCILPEGGRAESLLGLKVQGDVKECGQGYRYQAMVCYDQDNRLVETSRCNSHGEWLCGRVCVFALFSLPLFPSTCRQCLLPITSYKMFASLCDVTEGSDTSVWFVACNPPSLPLLNLPHTHTTHLQAKYWLCSLTSSSRSQGSSN